MNTCPGCEACRTGEVPEEFASDDEYEAFWDPHSTEQFTRKTTGMKVKGRLFCP